ncbi:MAG: isocitrate lyase/phosphoenolpyruvate mutase family protein [Gammaproteobacteria bacterium]|nr:isocitrate lyase/phosphoenolpyruvate mutase family protein [Gammaproteobacteria bacterium]
MSNPLSAQLGATNIVVAPGVYDSLSASIAERAGASALYLSGASIAYTRLGAPDIGLVSVTEVAATLGLICDRTSLPVIVDADTGFGNALNAARTMREFERQGAAAIQLEDQTLPKRCGHLRGKSLVTTAEMVGKIRAATDARQRDTLIVARTDAIAVEGFAAALDRADAYADAGADVLFVEAPRDRDEMDHIVQRLGSRVPLLANMVEGGNTPMHSANELERIGYSLVIFPGGLVRALAPVMVSYFDSLLANGTTANMQDTMMNFAELNQLLGTEDWLAQGQRYAGDAESPERDKG